MESRLSPPERFRPWQRLLLTVLGCATTTLLATPLLDYLDLANIVMLFLLTVLLLAVSLGRGAAVLAAVLSVLFFDLFFVPPRFSLAVANAQYLVTFFVMLVTGLLTGQLAAGLRQSAREAHMREQRTQALYEVARQLAGALGIEQVTDITRQFVQHQFNSAVTILLKESPGTAASGGTMDSLFARMAQNSGRMIRSEEFTDSGCAALYLPIQASKRNLGILELASPPLELPEEAYALLEALASLVAIALERLHYVEVAQTTQLNMVGERLRSSILSALSHDLRTPLTALVGLAESLTLTKPPLPEPALESAQAIHEQAARMASLVGNLLDMARLNAGDIRLRREWQPLEEVIGASIKLLGNALARHPVRVSLPPDLPLLEFDAVLLERVFCNLLENGAKYAAEGTPLEVDARTWPDRVEVRVRDQGPGLPSLSQAELFNMFVQGESDAGKTGTGLGLAICRAILEAHGGSIEASNRPEGGACFSFTLPRGMPPVLEEEAV